MPSTFTTITNDSRIPVRTCEQILANRMQCWKPGQVLVSSTPPATADNSNPATTQYQLCRAHATILQRAEQEAAQAEVPVEEVHKQMLEVNQVQTQTAPPKGEASINNQTSGPVTAK